MSDPGLRALERAAAGGRPGEVLAYARALRRVGRGGEVLALLREHRGSAAVRAELEGSPAVVSGVLGRSTEVGGGWGRAPRLRWWVAPGSSGGPMPASDHELRVCEHTLVSLRPFVGVQALDPHDGTRRFVVREEVRDAWVWGETVEVALPDGVAAFDVETGARVGGGRFAAPWGEATQVVRWGEWVVGLHRPAGRIAAWRWAGGGAPWPEVPSWSVPSLERRALEWELWGWGERLVVGVRQHAGRAPQSAWIDPAAGRVGGRFAGPILEADAWGVLRRGEGGVLESLEDPAGTPSWTWAYSLAGVEPLGVRASAAWVALLGFAGELHEEVVVVVERGTGRLRGTIRFEGLQPVDALVVEDGVIAAETPGSVSGWSVEGERRWRHALEQAPVALGALTGRLYAACEGGEIACWEVV